MTRIMRIKFGVGTLGFMLAVTGVAAFLAWNSYWTAQAHLKARLDSLATHASQSADALRVLPGSPDDQYERYRALFHLRSFNREANSLGRWAGTPLGISHSMQPLAALVSGGYSTDSFPEISRALFDIEASARQLIAEKRFISRSDVAGILDEVIHLYVAAPPADEIDASTLRGSIYNQ